MPSNLTKDIVFLVAGVLLSFALESQRGHLSGILSPEFMSLACLVVFAALTGGYLIFRHYHNVLSAGASPAGSSRRRAYDDLRASLSDGGTPARLYAKWLEAALHAVEHLFGEEKGGRQSLLQEVLGLGRPVTLWTAPALDRCILFAFIYPQTLLILGWLMSGRAGRAEIVLGLVSESDPLRRYVSVGAMLMAAFAYTQCWRSLAPRRGGSSRPAAHRTRFVLWLLVLAAGSLVTEQLLDHGPSAVGGAAIVASSVVGAVAGDILIAMGSGLASAVVAIVVLLKFGAFSANICVALTCAVIGLTASAYGGEGSAWQRLRNRLRRSHLFWWTFLALAIVFNIVAARLLSRSDAWPVVGPILLFYGLLPALNAPFLWFSLGLTRALLWLGLERKGWWPYFYALVDAAMAVLVIVLLIAVIVVGTQALNLMAVKGGGQPILPILPLLHAVFESLKSNSFDPEYWWVYTMLVSAMIPSLVNLAIGGFSLVRGIPVLSRALRPYLPEGHAVAPHDRNWIALVLTIQVIAGICLAFVSQFILLPWWIFGYVLPGLGFGVLEFAQSVEALDLPGRIWPL